MQIKYLVAGAVMLVFLTVSWALGSVMTQLSDESRYFTSLPKGFVLPKDAVGQLILREYGALFVARGGAVPPKTTVFRDEKEVNEFQASVEMRAGSIGGQRVELQRAAMDDLLEAIAEAAKAGLSIGPRGGDSSRRTYKHTVTLWRSRVEPGMDHWVARGKISRAEATRILDLSPVEQIPEILSLEKKGIYFARSLDKSIIYSVAPPGTSQHLSMLALDVKEFDDARVRAILAKHGWFQTVTSDLPHFTYLGVPEAELPGLGLKAVRNSGRTFWVPDIRSSEGSPAQDSPFPRADLK